MGCNTFKASLGGEYKADLLNGLCNLEFGGGGEGVLILVGSFGINS